jgi:photosystem II stability/assembly factor-like uncharacterized protein
MKLLLTLVLAALSLAAQFPESLFSGMRYRLIGPFRGGRALAVAGVPSQPHTYYFGAVAGGVWKTTDSGITWQPLWDRQPISSIGAMAVSESDPNVIYVGTGEACIRGNISYGDGVYKSTDAGKTWKHIGLRDTRHIGRMAVHPRNPDLVYVAALGHAYGPNAERGIFRSTNGGQTWEKVLYKDDKTGGIDVVLDPGNANVLFASLWEAHRSPWSMSSGGPGSGLYRSTDAGSTWKRLEGGGLPPGILGRIGVAVSGANSNRVYAMIEAARGGLYVSDNGGDTWRRSNDDNRLRERPWYYTHVYADPKSVDTVYVLSVGFFKSVDAGRTVTTIIPPHGDNHGLWIDPNDPQRMINANDGGANISFDGGRTWSRQDNQPTAQFYHVTVDHRFPYHVYGAQQDNSTMAIASRSDAGFIDRPDWYPVGGGESGYIAPRPDNPNVVYAGSYGGLITRFDKTTGQSQTISAWPENPMGHGAASLRHRFQWTAPILVSRHDPNVLYHAAEVLFRSTNEGMSWTQISPDLSRNDKSKMGPSGGPITKDNTSVEYYGTIFALAESPQQKDMLWAGTDDGRVHLTRDGGKTWTEITPREMPEWSMISIIEASPHSGSTAYLAVDRHKFDDFKPYIYKTADLGKTWTKITTGLPESYVHVVREDPRRKGLLYCGTETGVFVSFDDGGHWQPLQLNLPTAPIADLAVKDDDLVVGTHGRSFWILDDLTPLRQLDAATAAQEVILFKPQTALRVRSGGRGGGPRGGGAAGENPPAGAIINYYLKSAARDEITLEILDAKGESVRKLSSRERQEEGGTPAETAQLQAIARRERLPAAAGMHRVVWDLRRDPPSRVPGLALWGGNPRGALLPPGHFQVKLTAAGQTLTAALEVKLDPRLKIPQADLERQHELMRRIHQRVSDAHEAVNEIRRLRAQIKDLRARTGGSAAITAALDRLEKEMTAAEEDMVQVKSLSAQDPLNYPIKVDNKLTLLGGVVESADTAPTQQSYQVLELLEREVQAPLSRWASLKGKDLAALNELIRKENIPALK